MNLSTKQCVCALYWIKKMKSQEGKRPELSHHQIFYEIEIL